MDKVKIRLPLFLSISNIKPLAWWCGLQLCVHALLFLQTLYFLALNPSFIPQCFPLFVSKNWCSTNAWKIHHYPHRPPKLLILNENMCNEGQWQATRERNSWRMSETRQKGQQEQWEWGRHHERLLAWSLQYTSSLPVHERLDSLWSTQVTDLT